MRFNPTAMRDPLGKSSGIAYDAVGNVIETYLCPCADLHSRTSILIPKNHERVSEIVPLTDAD